MEDVEKEELKLVNDTAMEVMGLISSRDPSGNALLGIISTAAASCIYSVSGDDQALRARALNDFVGSVNRILSFADENPDYVSRAEDRLNKGE